MNEDTRAILSRLRRKADILRLDMKARNMTQAHDLAEMLTLIDMLEARLTNDRA